MPMFPHSLPREQTLQQVGGLRRNPGSLSTIPGCTIPSPLMPGQARSPPGRAHLQIRKPPQGPGKGGVLPGEMPGQSRKAPHQGRHPTGQPYSQPESHSACVPQLLNSALAGRKRFEFHIIFTRHEILFLL